MAKLTDKQRKMIFAELVEGATIRALAKKYGVSQQTILRIKQNGDEEFRQKVLEKREENTKSVLAYMDSRKGDVCTLIGMLLDALTDQDKIMATPLSQLATTMGIVIDKYTSNESFRPASDTANNLFEAINSCGEEGLDAIPEVQRAAENDPVVVENREMEG